MESCLSASQTPNSRLFCNDRMPKHAVKKIVLTLYFLQFLQAPT